MSRKRVQTTNSQPYTNMHTRKSVLISGFVFALISFALVLMSCLFLFVPNLNFIPQASPTVLLKWMLVSGIAVGFVSTVLTVAGANTLKSLARLSMFLSTVSFIVGAAVLVIILLFRTVLPLDAIARLSSNLRVI